MNFKAEKKTDKTNEMKLEFTIDAKIFEEGIQEVFKNQQNILTYQVSEKEKHHTT